MNRQEFPHDIQGSDILKALVLMLVIDLIKVVVSVIKILLFICTKFPDCSNPTFENDSPLPPHKNKVKAVFGHNFSLPELKGTGWGWGWGIGKAGITGK